MFLKRKIKLLQYCLYLQHCSYIAIYMYMATELCMYVVQPDTS